MKNISYLLLLILIYSCSSDNNNETEQSNTLIIKQIKDIGENNERNYYFDLNGRLDSITDTEAISAYNHILSKFMYSNDNKLISSYHTYGTEESFSNLDYSNNQISNYDYVTFGFSTDSQVTINNNIITYVDELEGGFEQDDINVEFTFSSDNLKYLTQRKNTLTSASDATLTLINYEYDDNFNRIKKHITVTQGNEANIINTLTYDDKKNPIAESMAEYKLALYFLDDYKLINMSPNNVLSKYSAGVTSIYDYIYNNDDYPISATTTNASTNEVTNTLTYTYY